jgi:REP element-mobilizing transposase RayT
LRYYHDEGLVWSYAYVVMPDHLHWLFQLRGHFTLSKLLNGVKSYSANELNRHRGREGTRVWQRGFHDHALRTEESIRNVARYVIANPIRAGLVTDIKSYSLWDAIWL